MHRSAAGTLSETSQEFVFRSGISSTLVLLICHTTLIIGARSFGVKSPIGLKGWRSSMTVLHGPGLQANTYSNEVPSQPTWNGFSSNHVCMNVSQYHLGSVKCVNEGFAVRP